MAIEGTEKMIIVKITSGHDTFKVLTFASGPNKSSNVSLHFGELVSGNLARRREPSGNIMKNSIQDKSLLHALAERKMANRFC